MYDSRPTHHTTSSDPALNSSLAGEESERVFEAARSYFAGGPEQFRPPHTNRGVRIERTPGSESEKPEKSDDYAKCAFDWYQASIPALPEAIQTAFCERFGGCFSDASAINGYEHGRVHSELKFSVYWGGHHDMPNVKATSHHAARIAPWVRERFPEHKVSRADVAFDFCFPGGFDYLTAAVEPLAKKAGVSSKFVGDLEENDPAYPVEDRTGRTWYFGSFKSDCMMTIYEKGLELRGKGIEGADPNLVRLEVRIRPQKQRKKQAAQLDPFELVGFSKWISGAVGAILEEAPTVLPNYDKLEKGPLASLQHMAEQYSGQIRAFLEGEDRGGRPRSWDDLARFLHSAMIRREAQRVAAGKEPRDPLPSPPRRQREGE